MRVWGGRLLRPAAAGLAFLLLLLLLVAGTSGGPVQHQVDGSVGGTVLLRGLLPPEKTVAKIEWDFQPDSPPAIVIAEFMGGNFERPNPGDRFQQRLEKADEATLRIKDLVKEDGGVYIAHVRFESAELQQQTFLLRISDQSEPSQQLKLLLIGPFIILMSYLVIWLLKDQMQQLLNYCLSIARQQLRPALILREAQH